MVLLFSISGALLFALLWMLFLKRVNIFSPLSWKHTILSFVVGCLSVIPVLLLIRYRETMGIPQFSGFGFQLFNVALVEEASKFLFFLFTWFLFKRSFNDAPDYLIFASLTALGFATVENIFYFDDMESGYSMLFRGIISTFSHMADTSIIAFSFYLGLRKGAVQATGGILIGLIIACLFHGLYNTFLTVKGEQGALLSFVLYFIEIELWALMFNNLLNLSVFYNDKTSLDQNEVKTMMSGLLLSVLLLNGIANAFLFGSEGVVLMFIVLGVQFFITNVLINRITRFVLVKDRWIKIIPALPFSFVTYNADSMRVGTRFRVKGMEFNEFDFTRHLHEEVLVRPLSSRNVMITGETPIQMTGKIYVGKDTVIYSVSFPEENADIEKDRFYYIVPKTGGNTETKKKPICGLMSFGEQMSEENFFNSKPSFHGWLVLQKPIASHGYWKSIKNAFLHKAHHTNTNEQL